MRPRLINGVNLCRAARPAPLLPGAGERAPDARPAPAQITGAKISVCHGVGGMFAASGTIIMPNEPR